MVIVAGSLSVDPDARAEYLAGCLEPVSQARSAPGCLDYAVSADLLDPGRINVYERWQSEQALQDFRGSGPDDRQQTQLREIRVDQYEVS
jgi:quinol monooxygenase YgiN